MPDLGDRLDDRFDELEPSDIEGQDVTGPEAEPDEPEVGPEVDDEAEEEKMGDYSLESLRAAQLANYEKEKAAGNNPIIADKSETNAKDYRSLTRVWFPLILDHPDNQTGTPQTPWTLEEILGAFYNPRNPYRGIIGRFATEYGRHRPGYQVDDGISDGIEAVMIALQKDTGRAPFANFAVKHHIKRRIQRAQKKSSTIPTAARQRTFSDRGVTSADAPIAGDPKLSIGSSIPQGGAVAGKVKCPVCGGSGGVPPDYISPYAARPKDPETGERPPKAPPCPTCTGSGYLAAPESRGQAAARTPAELSAEK
ncbi:MAG: hypothetical protein QF535_07685, partial [Anaerolineales bacterium]|nr:hypothetical protein [Anaerolineales bacterium]